VKVLFLTLETLKPSQNIEQFRYFPGRLAVDEPRVRLAQFHADRPTRHGSVDPVQWPSDRDCHTGPTNPDMFGSRTFMLSSAHKRRVQERHVALEG
jgi:hypothetical protein